MTVQKLLKIEQEVRKILERDERAREDDNYLYAILLKEKRPDLANMRVVDFFVDWKFLSAPNIKSVERARRKIQASEGELCPAAAIEREREEVEYITYSRV